MRYQLSKRPIGVFDSGLGGLTVVREIVRLMPTERIVYLGDTARLPYGTKSPESITRFAMEDASFLMSLGVKAVVVACSTASSVALDALRERIWLPVIGVVEAGARGVPRGAERVGVIGTTATVMVGKYKAIIEARTGAEVRQTACPLLVPLVEEGITQGPILDLVLEHYLSPMRDWAPQYLVLGCTHYPLLAGAIGDFFGPGTRLVDPSRLTAEALAELLTAEELMGSEAGGVDVYLTDLPPRYEELVVRFLGQEPRTIERVGRL